MRDRNRVWARFTLSQLTNNQLVKSFSATLFVCCLFGRCAQRPCAFPNGEVEAGATPKNRSLLAANPPAQILCENPRPREA
jgi:hypothetical protein